jgi:HSP20 family protein
MATKSTDVTQREQGRDATQREQGRDAGQRDQGREVAQRDQGRGEQGRGEQGRLARRDAALPFTTPFRMLERLADQMERLFGDVGLGRGWSAPQQSRGGQSSSGVDLWVPDVEMFQRDSELVIRVDLPGMESGDIRVDIADDAITIQGEREQEEEDQRGGVYRSERRYGAFLRVIPLPEGAITEQATATFRNGVLEITLPVPPDQATRGRRLEIGEGREARGGQGGESRGSQGGESRGAR